MIGYDLRKLLEKGKYKSAMTITWYREEQCRTNENCFYKFTSQLRDALEYHPLETDVISDILYALTRYDLKRLLKEVGE